MSAKFVGKDWTAPGQSLEPVGENVNREIDCRSLFQQEASRLPFSYSQIYFSCEIEVRQDYRRFSRHEETG